MRCRRARELLSRRIDRPLAPGDARGLETHLAGCAGCREHEGELAAMWARLEDPAPAPETPEQWPAILAGVAARRRRWAWLEPVLGLAPRPAMSVAALALAIGLGVAGASLLAGGRAPAAAPAASIESTAIAEGFGDLPVGSPGAVLLGALDVRD